MQSLSLLNSEFVRLRAQAFAKRIIARANSESGVTNATQEGSGDSLSSIKTKPALNFAFELAYSRPPTREELSAAKNFLKEQQVIYKDQPDATLRVWTDLCQMLVASNAFLYVD